MSGPPVPEEHIRSLVHKRMQAGELPVIRVRNIDGGYGSGAGCCVCEEPIQKSQVEYEAQVAEKRKLRFHIKCFALWQLECAQQLEQPGNARIG